MFEWKDFFLFCASVVIFQRGKGGGEKRKKLKQKAASTPRKVYQDQREDQRG